MPQRKSAQKELRKVVKHRQRNLWVKRTVKTAIKNLKKSIEDGTADTTKELLNETYKVLDKAVTKKVIHANKAARKKSRYAKLANTASSGKKASSEPNEG